MTDEQLGRVLVKAGAIDVPRLERALDVQRTRGGDIESILIDLGFVTGRQIVTALSHELRVPAANLSIDTEIAPEVLALLPRDLCSMHAVLPLGFSDGRLAVAMRDPSDRSALETCRMHARLDVLPLVAERKAIEMLIAFHFGEVDLLPPAQQAAVGDVLAGVEDWQLEAGEIEVSAQDLEPAVAEPQPIGAQGSLSLGDLGDDDPFQPMGPPRSSSGMMALSLDLVDAAGDTSDLDPIALAMPPPRRPARGLAVVDDLLFADAASDDDEMTVTGMADLGVSVDVEEMTEVTPLPAPAPPGLVDDTGERPAALSFSLGLADDLDDGPPGPPPAEPLAAIDPAEALFAEALELAAAVARPAPPAPLAEAPFPRAETPLPHAETPTPRGSAPPAPTPPVAASATPIPRSETPVPRSGAARPARDVAPGPDNLIDGVPEGLDLATSPPSVEILVSTASPVAAAPAALATAEPADEEAAARGDAVVPGDPDEIATAEVVPAEAGPAGVAPAEPAPAEAAPAAVAPAEVVPAEVAPAEIAPAEIAPAEIAPPEVAPAPAAVLYELRPVGTASRPIAPPEEAARAAAPLAPSVTTELVLPPTGDAAATEARLAALEARLEASEARASELARTLEALGARLDEATADRARARSLLSDLRALLARHLE